MVRGMRGNGPIFCYSEVSMASLGKICVALSVIAFILAVITAFTGPILVGAQAYSRACADLALIALCLFVGFKESSPAA